MIKAQEYQEAVAISVAVVPLVLALLLDMDNILALLAMKQGHLMVLCLLGLLLEL